LTQQNSRVRLAALIAEVEQRYAQLELELPPAEPSFECAEVRRPVDQPCRHCGAQRFEVLLAFDARGRHWDVERCGCRV
jgi:hypothetical protein